MNLSQNDKKTQGRLCLISAALLGGIYSLCCLVISPIYIMLISDIVFAGTAVPVLLSYLGNLLEVLAIAVFYGVLISATFRFGVGAFKKGLLVFAVATVYKYSLNAVMSWIMDGSVPTDWIWDLADVLFYSVLEMVQLTVVVLLVNGVARRWSEYTASLSKVGNTASAPYKNPITRSALFCALTVFVSKILGLLINDVFTIVMYGLPKQGSTVLLMLLAYLSNLIYGVLCYVTVLFTAMKLSERFVER